MQPLNCPHPNSDPQKQACAHLLEKADSCYTFYLDGHGQRYHLLCEACAESVMAGKVPALAAVCSDCFRHIEDKGYFRGIIGQPEVFPTPALSSMTHRTVNLPGLSAEDLSDIQPLEHEPGCQWIALTRSGSLVRLDFDRQEVSTLVTLASAPLDLTKSLSLELAPDGSFAAVANTFGVLGVVVEIHTGKFTMPLRREPYHEDVSAFSIAFFQHKGETLLIHATEWNRLDISNPATGECLTTREWEVPSSEEEPVEHDLDYFHGDLLVSPQGTWIADDGWIWHPVGCVNCWSLTRWIEENPWESEDGESLQGLFYRAYFWGGPMCWIDERRLAIWGYGEYANWISPAVRLFDVVENKEIRWFAGVEGGALVFDEYLFSLSQEKGLSAWNPEDGSCHFRDPMVTPFAYHRGAKTFLSRLADGQFRLSAFNQAV